ncbi:MAG: Crp/Fnr family transcriptional regulator [Eubacteriales bacterium]|nr:Crp/Fnr family transcriptional regulator [Eubacteriales bacterium]
MEEYFEILKSVELFQNIRPEELPQLLACLDARVVRYIKNQTVFSSGESIRRFGIVLSGGVQVVHDDFYGNRSILGNFGTGELFGESFACAQVKALPVSVIATAESEVMLIDCQRLAVPCARACGFHGTLIRNLMGVISQKNIALTRKMELTSKRTTREKLTAYLMTEAQRAGASRFTIPFDRQGLADYLSVDRSAMSAELSRLKRDGILDYHKNRFALFSPDEGRR